MSIEIVVCFLLVFLFCFVVVVVFFPPGEIL